jgi:uncharacterized membrane protein YeaQ/YmgE (transglycosylase-associated protein family)
MSFTPLEILILLIIAGVCGALGQMISGVGRGGILVSIAVGFIGALFGAWIARAMELPEPFALRVGEAVFPVVWSIIGATLFMLLVGLARAPFYPRD